ncbi:MAG: hypothetical protein FH749_13270 [Firmicutes bacterium]|nr:hypothetical protein [Bacillota bacterium]
MPGKLLIIDTHRFMYSKITNYSFSQQSVYVVKEDVVDMFWGLQYKTGLSEREVKVNILHLEYGDEHWFFHDSSALYRTLSLFDKLRAKGELSPKGAEKMGVGRAYRDSLDKQDWHYVGNITSVVQELEENIT